MDFDDVTEMLEDRPRAAQETNMMPFLTLATPRPLPDPHSCYYSSCLGGS